MRKAIFVAAAVIGIGVAMTPWAQAENSSVGLRSGEERAVAAADGLLHVWEHPFAGGKHCTWVGKSNNWDECGMRNKGSDIWNNGYAGNNDDVWLHYNTSNTGAYVCIGRGTSWNNLTSINPPPPGTQRITFWANTGSGSGQPIADNVASHEWGNC
ncbi:Putative secreted protein [Amycolatopsis japonica]|uniref:Putative secreted protein n=1 Tax=Amycolatopsis japonica TaxID=208439 RepID=A0A075V0W7_9PSEU|nr:hypothetical protein [Amycolatopsis japonica]AIG76145.1 Putative secreted protein [Amycolatopsis japonica]